MVSGAWLVMVGRPALVDKGSDEKVRIAVHETVRAIGDEADALRRSDRDTIVGSKKAGKVETDILYSDLLQAWARASEGAAKMAAIDKHAAPYLFVAPERLDADPWLINVANGTIVVDRDAAQGADVITFRRHAPADLITKLSPVEYDRQATCPRYDAFLADVQPRDDNRRFIHAWKGLSMTGDASEQVLAVFWGRGKNGKSTFEEAAAFVAGDYGETVPIETFLDQGRGRNAGQATPDLALLPAVRMLRTSEPDKGAKLSESLIKLVTGGEPIQARKLNHPYFRFTPVFKLTVSGNYRPRIEGTDEGIWRRVILVPWNVTIPVEKRDKRMTIKLRREASGILNRFLDGLRDWIDRGLVKPEEVEAATTQYRQDSDPLGRFLADCVRAAAGKRIQATQLHQVFEAWAKANGERVWTANGLGRALRDRGFVSIKNNVVFWEGVELIKTVNDFVDHEGRPLGDGTNAGGGAADPGKWLVEGQGDDAAFDE
jgi:putative DNA primase/helicase